MGCALSSSRSSAPAEAEEESSSLSLAAPFTFTPCFSQKIMLAPARWGSQQHRVFISPQAANHSSTNRYHHPSSHHHNTRLYDPANEVPRLIRDKRNDREYFLSMYLGKGGFGRCFRAESGRDRYAIKIIDKNRLKKESHWSKIRKEIAIQSRLAHSNVLMMHSCFDSNTEIFMILEYCSEGSLLDYTQMAEGRRLSEAEAVGFLYQLMSGVNYLHNDCKVLHRDLKPGNLLLAKNGVLKVADFGLACFMDEMDYSRPQSVCGTPNYISPEVLRNSGHSLASEAWAIGCIFYFMMMGIPPFETESLGETYDRIKQGKYYFPSNVYISNYGRQLIETLLDTNVNTRLPPQKILSHRIFHRSHSTGSMHPRFSKSASNLAILGSEGHTMLDSHSGKGSVTPPHLTVSSRMLAESSLSRYSSTADIASRAPGRAVCERDYNGNNLKMLYSDSPPLSDDAVVPMANNSRYSFTQSLEVYIDTLDALFLNESRMNMLELREMPRDMLCILCWIDYRNAYGFGCTLNNGTRSLVFNDGSSISQRGELMGFMPKLSSAFRDPYEWVDSGDEFQCPANLREKRNLLSYTSNYMARELCSKFGENLSDSPTDENRELTYIVSAYQKNDQIIMGLSNGTCQMNDKDTHSKYVLGIDECGGVTLTILSQGETATSYSVHLGAGRKPLPVELNCLRKFRDLLTTQHRLLMKPNRSICSTDC
ncbi:hypothetical protein L596_001548 [Steinernema carpocapsae]|uniref:Serine/threonine-protein kinase PLK n=1 Tax=Steinernema carpocapsae TaxID=34508 RepID=A0A4U8UP50_STECR|nr:hypothetical protein L596_001548 [Steinernema carpocapsae]